MYYIVYKTTNIVNNKTYIGIHKTEKLNDGYLGSGNYFLKAVKKYGKENFEREILKFCESYDELLEEEKKLVDETWVKDKNNYNIKTGGQSNGVLSEESKNKISETLKKGYKEGRILPIIRKEYIVSEEHRKKISDTLKERYKNSVHHLKGKESPNKGKKSLNIPWNKNKTGLQTSWCKGLKLGPMSDEQKELISNTLKERYRKIIHHSKGVETWNKGIKMPKVECPYCGKLVDISNGTRWHFENCKFK